MKAAIYTPYLDTLGGGERYVLSVAKILSDSGWSVYLESQDDKILNKVNERFSLNLSGVKLVKSINRGDGFDLCFWLSDGSIPTLSARKNILHFQRPFYKVGGKSLLNRAKFFRINKVVVNSKFTKEWTDREYPVESFVLYPPVDVSKLKSKKKENLILYIGRFSQLEQSKGQDILIEAFKNFYDNFDKSWKLVLAGGSEVGRTDYTENLYQMSTGYPIEIKENVSFSTIKDLYGKAKIFWSAAGYGIDQKLHPEKLEHFGMTAVESMAAGCVPILFKAGGHTETVENEINGYLWENPSELVIKTSKISKDPGLLRSIGAKAKETAQNYSYEKFKQNLLSLV